MNHENFKKRLLFIMCMVLSISAFAQSRVISGKVTDSKGETLPGVSILIQGTTNGTSTDVEGNFSLKAENGNVLVFSFIGYKTQYVKLEGQTTLNVVLQDDVEKLDEVIVIGYATGSKRTISGAVEKVGREDMNTGIVANPLQSIKGRVAGVNIMKNGGDPTAGASIRVRGTTSLSGGNDPLVIIDGVFGDLSMLNAIAPSDIQDFTILKDASETAQYGSRGASGVIVVSTAKGKYGTKSISYDGSFGVETVYDNIEMLSAAQYRQAVKDGNYVNAMDKGYNTNFIKEMERTAYTQSHRLSFSGGTESSNYRASIGVIDQKGVLKKSSMRNYTAKIDAGQKMFNDKLKIDFGMFASRKELGYTNDYQKTFYSAAAYNPTFPNHKNEQGKWDENPNANEVQNPLGRLEIDDNEENTWLNTNLRLTWNILEGLSLSAFGSYSNNVKENKTYIPNDIKAGQSNRGNATRSDNKQNILLGNLTLNYKNTIGKHRMDFLGLGELQKYMYTGFNVGVRGFGTNYFGYNNLSAGADIKWGDAGSYKNSYGIASFMGRFNYSYDDRYIATVNLRGDGSSKLGENEKWGFFPSGSVAWVISRESFMKDVDFMSNLKVRAGYGVTGNQDAISPFNSLQLMSPSGVTSVNGVPTVTYGYTRNYNPDLRWEKKEMFDVGVDAAFFNNRLTVTADYYQSKTKDLLYNYAVPQPPFVYGTLLANLGEMENNGVEVSLSGTPLRTGDWEINVNANFSWQKNKLLSLDGHYMGQDLSAKKYTNLGGMNGAGFIGGNNQIIYQMVGQPLGVFYLPKSDGLVDNGYGEYSYHILNLDEDPNIDLSDGKDRYIAGQAMPKYYLGGNVNIRWKQFDVSTQLTGAFGHKIYNGTSLTYMNMNQFPTYNVMKGAPQKNIKDQTVTDYWLERGDYVHFDYVTLGWTMNTKKSEVIKSLRVTFSINNLATITNYSGLSPMINSSAVGGDLGIDDKRFYPLSRTYSLGLSVNF